MDYLSGLVTKYKEVRYKRYTGYNTELASSSFQKITRTAARVYWVTEISDQKADRIKE